MGLCTGALGYSETYKNLRVISIIHASCIYYTFLFDSLLGIIDMILKPDIPILSDYYDQMKLASFNLKVSEFTSSEPCASSVTYRL